MAGQKTNKKGGHGKKVEGKKGAGKKRGQGRKRAGHRLLVGGATVAWKR